jgi:hypothetical protein
MKIDCFKIAVMGCLSCTLMACNQAINPNVSNTSTPSPAQGDATQMVEPLPTSSNPGLQVLIERAKEDLAQRLSLPVTQITLVDAVEVEWSDSSLDCPQPGMEYLQVVTPGYRIQLEYAGIVYEYHSSRDTYVVYCEDPVPPIIPKP